MTKLVKLLNKLNNSKNTFVWTDLVTLLAQLGYTKKEMAGSRVRFYNEKIDSMILLHKPHPENEIKGGALKSVKTTLKQEGLL
jgi:predicted RNA binding protein YcfA (HicA-like mRNA interferase family)